MSEPSYIAGKSKTEMLTDLVGRAEPGSPVHEQQKMAIMVRCVEDLEKAASGITDAMRAASIESRKLGTRVFWLNVVLAVATLVGAIATVVAVLKV